MIRRVTVKTLSKLLSPRRADSHKGDFGRVLVIAGSRGMIGAASLTATGALRSGAGLVFVGTPRSLQPVLSTHLTEALTLPLPETRLGTLHVRAVPLILRFCELQKVDAVVLGPGLSADPKTSSAVLQMVKRLKLPLVLDADALNALSADVVKRLRRRGTVGVPEVRGGLRRLFGSRRSPTIVTPHPGEAARILGVTSTAVQRARRECVERIAKDIKVVALLKGHRTLIANDSDLRVNPTGNPGLAKGGTGDVLAGLIGGLWAQLLKEGKDPTGFEAATLGAYVHGKAADLAVRRWGTRALVASDLFSFLPPAFRFLGIK